MFAYIIYFDLLGIKTSTVEMYDKRKTKKVLQRDFENKMKIYGLEEAKVIKIEQFLPFKLYEGERNEN